MTLTDKLNENIIKSHINSDTKMLAKHYLEAANLFKGSIEEPFFFDTILRIFFRIRRLKNY